MKRLLKGSLLLATFMVNVAVAGPVVVIVNSANTQNLTKDDVRSIYGDKTVAWQSGSQIAVYNLPPDDPVADAFASKALGMSAREAAAAESNRIITNTARNPQRAKRSALVASIVSKTPEAIGYVDKADVEGKSGIRVVLTLD